MPLHASNKTNGHGDSSEFVRKEALRFETFYKDLFSAHEILEKVDNITIKRRLREILHRIEDNFISCPEFTISNFPNDNELRLGVVGGSLSGKSALVHCFLTGSTPKDEVLSGRHKKAISVDGSQYLLLIRDETGPPDPQFSAWADAILLVFSLSDELSFNVISSYYAKMVQHRDKVLPVVLVAVKDTLSEQCPSVISHSRVKKFISDHGNCPFFVVSVSTADKVDDVFQTASEKIIQSHSANVQERSNLQSLSLSSLTDMQPITSSSFSLGSTPHHSLKKVKRRTALFSKNEKKDDVLDDVGSGRTIPIKQGYLYKRSHGSIKEWKKKYVALSEDGKLMYYPSMKDYIEDSGEKSISLFHTTVKVAGRKHPATAAGKVPTSTPVKPQNHLSVNGDINKKPTPTKPQTLHPTQKASLDAFVITNSVLLGNSPPKKQGGNTSPTSGKADANSASQNSELRNNKRLRRHGSRHKSCELDYTVISHSDAESGTTPNNSRRRNPHRRQKSISGRDFLNDKGTDTEDEDLVFTIISLEGKSWDFEALNQEDRDFWVAAIEQSIMRALQSGLSTPTGNKDRSFTDLSRGAAQSVSSLLQAISGNNRCADCNSNDPDWASLNLGMLICIECSGVHRNLGSHLSRVRSLDLDDWPSELTNVMLSLGNEFANSIWEATVPLSVKPEPGATREEREAYINRKYKNREFLSPGTVSAIPLGQQLIDAVKCIDRKECYRLLVRCSTEEVNSRDRSADDMTALHIACLKGDAFLTQMLLWYNANPSELDGYGNPPMYQATISGSRPCMDLLRNFGYVDDTPC